MIVMIDIGANGGSVGSRLCPHDLDGQEVIEQNHGVPDKSVCEGDNREYSTDQVDACNKDVDVDHAGVKSLAQREENGDVEDLTDGCYTRNESEGQNHAQKVPDNKVAATCTQLQGFKRFIILRLLWEEILRPRWWPSMSNWLLQSWILLRIPHLLTPLNERLLRAHLWIYGWLLLRHFLI